MLPSFNLSILVLNLLFLQLKLGAAYFEISVIYKL